MRWWIAAGALCGMLAAGAASDDLAAKSGRAKEAMAAGRYDEAAAIYRELLRSLPGHAGLTLNLGLAEYSAGRHRESIPRFESVVKAEPGNGAAWLLLGMAHLKLGEPARAVDPLRKAVELQPAAPMARLELADALLSLGRPAGAAAHFRRLTELDPKDPRGWYGLGSAHVARSRELFAELERTAPDSGYRYALLARSRAEQRQPGSAFHLYREAQARLPGMRGIHAAVAGIYRQEGRPDWAAAEEAREKALPPPDCAREPLECAFAAGRYREIADAPDEAAGPESLYWRARAHGELARAAFVRLAELPPSAVSHRLAAEIRRLEDRHAESAAEWRKALEFEPADDNLRIELARSLMAGENSREALPVLEEVLGRRPKHAESSLLAGRCLLSLQEPERAVPHLEAAVAAMPRDLDARAALGQAYLQSGDPKRALPELEAAAAADEDGNLNYLLAQAYARLGNQEAARRALAAREERRKAVRERAEERERTYRLTGPPAPRP